MINLACAIVSPCFELFKKSEFRVLYNTSYLPMTLSGYNPSRYKYLTQVTDKSRSEVKIFQ